MRAKRTDLRLRRHAVASGDPGCSVISPRYQALSSFPFIVERVVIVVVGSIVCESNLRDRRAANERYPEDFS